MESILGSQSFHTEDTIQIRVYKSLLDIVQSAITASREYQRFMSQETRSKGFLKISSAKEFKI